MNYLGLAIRLLRRDGQRGELTVLVLALIIAVASSSAIGLFSDRLQRTMRLQVAEFLAADMVITSPALLPEHWLNRAKKLALQQARTAEFSTVLVENNALLLVGVKAVSTHYPLRGVLKTSQSIDLTQQRIRHQGPKKGEVWLEPRVLSHFNLHLQEHIMVGEKSLTITGLLHYEPDKRGDLYSLSPRVMMNDADLASTQVLKPGSHVHYFFQFKGSEQALEQFKRWIKPHLNASQRLMDIREDRPELGSALTKTEQYLGLSSVVVVLIAGVAIALSARRYSQRHFDTSAIFRCLGCQQNDVLLLFVGQFLIIGTIASLIGCLLGWWLQQALFYLLADLLPSTLATPGWFQLVLGFLTGLVILFGFALPPLLQLKRVSPLRVFRRDLEPLSLNAGFGYGLVLFLILGLSWQYTHTIKMTAIIIGSLVLMGLLSVLIYGLIRYSQRLLPHLNLPWKMGIKALSRQPRVTMIQISGLTLTLLAMLLIYTVKSDLLTDWQRQLPEQAPNYFVLNLFPEQLSVFQQQLEQQNISHAPLFPVVRGRLVAINQQPVQQIVSKDSAGERATHRDLSLTWASTLPTDNQTVAGRWQPTVPGLLSIEQKLAKNLRINLGDQLTFTVGSQPLVAKVTHIRRVRWDTMKPNFYMIFSPGTLTGYPTTYLTSFYLATENKSSLNTLVKDFPAITLLEVDAILQQFKTILGQLTAAVNYLLYFALLAGFSVLFAAVYSSLDERIYEGALLRTLGAERQLLIKAYLIEFALLGLIAGGLAVALSNILSYLLYAYVLHLDYSLNTQLWVAVPMVSAICIMLIGLWGVSRVLKQSPLHIFRAC